MLAVACASPDARAISTEVRIAAASGITLAGTLSRPVLAGVARPRVAILVSGSGPQDRDGARGDLPGYLPFRDLDGALTARGIAVLRLDDRGTGASSGRFTGATTLDFADDLGAAIDWLRDRTDVDGARPALVGHSEGALVALLAAARDSNVAALVLMGAPSRTGRELARWQRAGVVTSDAAAYPPSSREETLRAAEHDAERAVARDTWLRTWFSLDPRAVARATHAPALILHGENDRQVPVQQSEELASALRDRRDARGQQVARVDLRRFPGTDHLLLEDHDGDPRGYVRLVRRKLRARVVDAITEWLTPQLGIDGRPAASGASR